MGWRCPKCATPLVKGTGGNVRYEARVGQDGSYVVNPRTGKPRWDAYCKECGSKAHG